LEGRRVTMTERIIMDKETTQALRGLIEANEAVISELSYLIGINSKNQNQYQSQFDRLTKVNKILLWELDSFGLQETNNTSKVDRSQTSTETNQGVLGFDTEVHP
jgi:hypothetical protein